MTLRDAAKFQRIELKVEHALKADPTNPAICDMGWLVDELRRAWLREDKITKILLEETKP